MTTTSGLVRPALGLALLALVAFWPRWTFEEWQGTEARRVQIAREMLERGDWMVPTLGHEPTFAKPPLHYWILAAAQSLGPQRWLARLPSVIAFWLLSVLAFWLVRGAYGRAAGAVAAFGILLSPVLLHQVPTAEIDPGFAALTAASVMLAAGGAAYRVRRWLVLGGMVGGLALLSKGPPYFLFLAGALVVWARRLKLFGLFWFLAPLLLVPACYYVPLVTLCVSPQEVFQTAERESVGRLFLFEWKHVVDTPAYLMRAVAVLMPLGLWTFHEFRGRRVRPVCLPPEEACLRVCAAGAIGGLVLLTFFPARPTRYLLPAVPLFVCAVAPAVAAYARDGRQIGQGLLGLVRAAAIVGAAGLAAVAFLPYPMPGAGVVAMIALALAPRWIRARRHVVAYALVVPLVFAWSVFFDLQCRQAAGPRGYSRAARALAREMHALGVSMDDLETRGHFPSHVLLEWGRIPPGDEWLRRPPRARWLLVEDPDRHVEVDASSVEGYRERVRVRVSGKSLVLLERVAGR